VADEAVGDAAGECDRRLDQVGEVRVDEAARTEALRRVLAGGELVQEPARVGVEEEVDRVKCTARGQPTGDAEVEGDGAETDQDRGTQFPPVSVGDGSIREDRRCSLFNPDPDSRPETNSSERSCREVEVPRNYFP
jgi:hypothetical protein